MDADTLLQAIRQRAHDLGGDRDAYEQAIVDVIIEEAERPRLTELQQRILKALETLSPRYTSPPIRTMQLITALDALDNRWYAWSQLSALESMGLVYRPDGPRRGWKAVSRAA